MTFNDGYCDYCHRRVEMMDNDSAINLRRTFWCGWCREGRDKLFSKVSTDKLQSKLADFRTSIASGSNPEHQAELHNYIRIWTEVLADREPGK